MAAVQGILDRLGAAGQLLAEPSSGHAQTSRDQADCILAMLGDTPLRAAAGIQLAQAVGAIKWADEDRRRLLDSITSRAEDGGRSRAALQNYEAFAAFLTEPLWAGLQSSADMHAKGRLIVDHAISLGLRHPTEGTSAVLTAVLLVAHEGPMRARSLERWFTRDIFLHLKKLVKQRARAPAIEIVSELPGTPEELRQLYPATFKSAFASSSPVPSLLSLADLAAVKSCIMLRDRARAQLGNSQIALQGPQQSQDLVRSLGSMLMQALLPHGHRTFQQLPGLLCPPRGADMTLACGGQLILTQPGMSTSTPLKRSFSALSQAEAPTEVPPVVPWPLAAPTPAPLTPPAPTTAAPTVEQTPQDSEMLATSGKRVGKKSVEEATALVLAAMTAKEDKKQLGKAKTGGGTKPEKPTETKGNILKRPASSSVAPPEQPTAMKRPTISHEASRNQYLFRSGDSPSKIFKYHDEASAKRACQAAQKMLRDELERRGL